MTRNIDAAAVRGLLANKSMSQKALATAAGITPEQLSRLMSGRHTTHDKTIKALADVLRVDPDDITLRPENLFSLTPHEIVWLKLFRRFDAMQQAELLVEMKKRSETDAAFGVAAEEL